MDFAGGEPTNLLESSPYDAHHLLWPLGSESVYARVSDRTNAPLVRITTDAVETLTPSDRPVVCTDYHVGQTGLIAAVIEDDCTVPELYAIEDHGTRRPLTELNKQFGEQYALPRQEVVRWQTDIGEVEGLLTYPVDDGRRTMHDGIPNPHPQSATRNSRPLSL